MRVEFLEHAMQDFSQHIFCEILRGISSTMSKRLLERFFWKKSRRNCYGIFWTNFSIIKSKGVPETFFFNIFMNFNLLAVTLLLEHFRKVFLENFLKYHWNKSVDIFPKAIPPANLEDFLKVLLLKSPRESIKEPKEDFVKESEGFFLRNLCKNFQRNYSRNFLIYLWKILKIEAVIIAFFY